MSDSRLEKFIYAICSMDVSDLPVPLSRIEKLWNCLITGETPDFEPLSRNEKYLMAMLDRYDISNLPAPMSRGEKLLYKIAVGETDLSDVPGYLSRYEELLKYLIENGGISGGDFEYVLHTLNQSLSTLYLTAEKPVKSAILSGRTLVNIKGEETNDVPVAPGYPKHDFLIPLVKKNTDYLIKYDTTLSDGVLAIGFLKDVNGWSNNSEGQPNIGLIRLNSGEYPNYFRIIAGEGQTVVINNLMIIEYQEGMENWDIPCFEGMKSVQMSVLTTIGKNLFDKSTVKYNTRTQTIDGQEITDNNYMTSDFIEVKPNTTYTSNYMGVILYYDENRKFIGALDDEVLPQNLTTPNNCKYIRIRSWEQYNTIEKQREIVELEQLEENSVATPYEPYKSNILSCNEEVMLRGIGDVKDELNCLTGEVVERIKERVFNGSEKWVQNGQHSDGSYRHICNTYTDAKSSSDYIICDKIGFADVNYITGAGMTSDINIIKATSTGKMQIATTKNINELKAWLAQNPITIQYELATESIKTVDLTVVDQDNQPTELGTFENVTYVSLEAENLIPEVEMEVATTISAELASASPLMDDISTKQEQLSITVDKQSENVDATMMATTEIYEETL